MAVLEINGSIDFTILNDLDKPVSEQTETKIIEKLQKGEYFLAFLSKTITDSSFKKLYNIEWDQILDDTEYNFDIE